MLKINYSKDKMLGNKIKLVGTYATIFEELSLILFDNFLPKVKEDNPELAKQFYDIIKKVVKEDSVDGKKGKKD